MDRLVETNLHLLRLASGAFSRKYPMIPREDIEQSAFFGLRRAAELFDETKGAQFHTYAFNWIRATIQQEFFRMGSLIRVPKRPTAPAPKISSLDASRGGNSAETFGALLVDDRDSGDPMNEAHRADLRERLVEALKTLIPRDAEIIALRYGINGASHPHTLTEVARHYGVCSQRIGEIERRAFRNLREALAAFAV